MYMLRNMSKKVVWSHPMHSSGVWVSWLPWLLEGYTNHCVVLYTLLQLGLGWSPWQLEGTYITPGNTR